MDGKTSDEIIEEYISKMAEADWAENNEEYDEIGIIDSEDEKIKIEKDGKIIECDICFTFESEDTMRAYIGYTDNSFTDGKKNLYVSAIDILDPDSGLHEVTDERELVMIMEVLESIEDKAVQGKFSNL